MLEGDLSSEAGSYPIEVVKRCLQGEEVPLDVQGVRERVLRIGRVAQVVKDGDEDAADLCARWLIGGYFLSSFFFLFWAGFG